MSWGIFQPHSNQIRKQFSLDLKLKRDCFFFRHCFFLWTFSFSLHHSFSVCVCISLSLYQFFFVIVSVVSFPSTLFHWMHQMKRLSSVTLSAIQLLLITIIVIISVFHRFVDNFRLYYAPQYNRKPHSLSAHLQQNFSNMPKSVSRLLFDLIHTLLFVFRCNASSLYSIWHFIYHFSQIKFPVVHSQ